MNHLNTHTSYHINNKQIFNNEVLANLPFFSLFVFQMGVEGDFPVFFKGLTVPSKHCVNSVD